MKNKWFLLAFVVVIVSAFVSWTYIKASGNEITVCVKNNGSVYVVGENYNSDECKANDTLLTWNITGPVGPQGPQGEPGPIGPQGPAGTSGEGLHVYDAGNQDLGILISTDRSLSNIETYIPSLNAVFGLRQNVGLQSGQTYFNVWSEPEGAIYFTNTNCTGNAYTTHAEGLAQSIKRLGNTNRFFKIVGELATNQVYTQSSMNIYGQCSAGGHSSDYLIRAQEVTLPFSYPPVGPLEIR